MQLLRRAADGESDLLSHRGQTSEERDAYVNQENQREVDARRELDVETLLRQFVEAREQTRGLIRQLASSGPTTIALTAGRDVPIEDLAGGSASHARLHLELLERALGPSETDG